jgi:hypothetical protein
MRKCANFSPYRYVAVSHICMTLHPIPLNFLIFEENVLFFFISVEQDIGQLNKLPVNVSLFKGQLINIFEHGALLSKLKLSL